MSRTKREKTGRTDCGYEWGGTPKLSAENSNWKCPHICRLDYKHEGNHYCCSTEDGETNE